MSQNSKMKKEKAEEGKSTADYYKLHHTAVEDLVTADKTNSPAVSEQELRKYRSGTGIKLSDTVKLLIIKWWFPAAVCYFFIWGLSLYMGSMLDLLFVTGIALGIVTDVLTNNAIRFFARTPGENDRFMMFPFKSYRTFPLNIVYAWIVLFFVYTFYHMINAGLMLILRSNDIIVLGVEPILFGVIYVAADSMLIKGKLITYSIIEDARKRPH